MIEEKRQVYEFDEFRLDVAKRQLLREGEVVPLYSKAFDLLLLLVEGNGRDLSKDEILESIWPGQILEESNLTVNISAVRKALGEKAAQPRFLVTIPGRGYRFVGNIAEGDGDANEGLVLESQTISQVIVEHEEIDEAGTEPTRLLGRTKPRISIQQRLVFGGPIAVIAIGAGAYVWWRGSRANKTTFQHFSIKRLTTKGTVSRAALSPDGKVFVYSIPDGEKEALWLGHVDGGEAIQIREPIDYAYDTIKFNPDGTAIYYSIRESTSSNSRSAGFYKMPLFGGVPEKVRDSFGNATFSPDGKRIAFFRRDQNRGQTILMTSDAAGGNEREIATMPSEIGSSWHSPAWSPDSSTIIVAATVKIDQVKLFYVNVTDGSTKALTQQVWRALEGATWLKDGSGVVGVGVDNRSVHPQVWLISFPEGESRQLTADLNDYGYVTSVANDNSLLALQGISQSNVWVAPADDLSHAKQITFDSPGASDGWNGLAWTQDGRIVYTADDAYGRSLWVINAGGGKPQQLTPNGGLNSYPSVSANGQYLVFQSNRSGHFAIWRSDLKGVNLAQLTGDQAAGQPAISPDGQWVIYNSSVDGLGELFRISINGGEAFRLYDKPTGWAFISPDNKMVACQMSDGGTTKVVILSLERGEILKSFSLPRTANLRLGVHWTRDNKAVSYRDWANGIWKQDLAGGEPQRLQGLPKEKLFSFDWAPDGKSFAYSRGSTSRDVVLITNEK